MPGDDKASHRAALTIIIKAGLVAGQLGHSGESGVPRPVLLKRWVEHEFDKVNGEHGDGSEGPQDDAGVVLRDEDDETGWAMVAWVYEAMVEKEKEKEKTKTRPRRNLRPRHAPAHQPAGAQRTRASTKVRGAGVSKPAGVQKRPVMNTLARDVALAKEVEENGLRVNEEDQAAAAALMGLAVARPVAEGLGLPPVPALSGSREQAFVKGVQYAWQARHHPLFEGEFVLAVEKVLGLAGLVRRRHFWAVV